MNFRSICIPGVLIALMQILAPQYLTAQQGVGSPAPVQPPAQATVQTPDPRVLTQADKANMEQSMAEFRELNENVDNAEGKSLRADGTPSDFPAYRDTGDPAADRARYAADKEEWIMNHPDEYQQLLKPEVNEIPEAEFREMPEDRQQEIRSNPEIYRIVPIAPEKR